MIVFWVGAGAGVLAGWACGWAITSWWRDRPDRVGPPWWWKPWLRFRRGDEDEAWSEHLEAALLEERPPLPPERSREELGFTGPVYLPRIGQEPEAGGGPPMWEYRSQHLAEERERRAPWWEAEHRAAYESLGFDYPSGLMTRVRELTP